MHFEHYSIAEALPYVLLFSPLVLTVMGLTACNCFVSEDTDLLCNDAVGSDFSVFSQVEFWIAG